MNVVGRRRARGVHGEDVRERPDEELISPLGDDAIDLGLAERAVLTRIDDRRAERLQVIDRLVDDVDRLDVGLREQGLVHVLAHDADAHAVESRRGA